MPFQDFLSRHRLSVAAALYVAAGAAGLVAWLHAASQGAVMFLCGSGPEAHCWACYAAPMLALAGVTVLAAPDRARQARAACR